MNSNLARWSFPIYNKMIVIYLFLLENLHVTEKKRNRREQLHNIFMLKIKQLIPEEIRLCTYLLSTS